MLTAAENLDRPIRWVHVSELSDIGQLLSGDELVLTTGIALPEDRAGLHKYVEGLMKAQAGAIVLELGRRFNKAPTALTQAAQAAGLPLVVLEQEVPFVEVTQAVHSLIVDARVQQLERSELVHRRFTELSVEGASSAAIVSVAAELCGQPVVLENLAHQVVVFAPGSVPATELLEGWERRSRSVPSDHYEARIGPRDLWTTASVAARGERWGRLVAAGEETNEDTALVLERAAGALALNRLSERDEAAMQIRAHHEVLTQLLDRSYVSVAGVRATAAAVGVPLQHRRFLGVDVTYRQEQQPNRQSELLQPGFAERVLAAATQQHVSALVDPRDAAGVRVLVSLNPQDDPVQIMDALAGALHLDAASSVPQLSATVGVGSAVTDIGDVRRTLTEAEYVGAAAPATGPQRAYYQLPDVRVKGLIHVLRHDVRLQDFVERELAPLVATDERGSDHIRTLTAYLDQGCNKSRTAAALHLSRPALYARLETIGRTLGADLNDPDTCLSLHVALIGLESLRRGD